MEPPEIREHFNKVFTQEKYQNVLKTLNDQLPSPIPLRIAESPLFLSRDLCNRLVKAGSDIWDFILHPDFKKITEKAIPDKWRCANEADHPHIVTIDFAIGKDEDGHFIPKLIELQGFPSLHGLDLDLSEAYREHYEIPDKWTIYFNGMDKPQYLDLLKRTILGPYQPEEVVLMDVNAPEQKTAADFYFHKKYLNIPIISITDLRQEGRKLYYEQDGQRKLIKRIYNRLIFDEVDNDPDLFKKVVDFRQDLDVDWIPHPNWYYRISKWILPLLKGDCILKTYYLNDILNNLPNDLENYVLKPLFSFGGTNVCIDVTKEDIDKIDNPTNWILERKFEYQPVFKEEDSYLKAEVRLMYFWPDGDSKPTLTFTCTRLTPGKMISVGQNKHKKWAGTTVSFIQK